MYIEIFRWEYAHLESIKPIEVQTIAQIVASGRLILIVSAEATVGGELIGMSIAIPISSITSAVRYWEVSDRYNGGTDMHFQVGVTTTSIEAKIYYGSAQQTLSSVKFFAI